MSEDIMHDPRKPIGRVVAAEPDGRTTFEFTEDVRITDKMSLEIFGAAGILVTEMDDVDGVRIIKKGQLLKFSLVEVDPASETP